MGAFLIGCLVLFVGCAGVRSGASQEEQGHTEATKEQAHSPEATSEEDRCEGTQATNKGHPPIVTNDLPGCPKGGLLSGTDKSNELDGGDGNDEIHGLGDKDFLYGGDGSDVLYGGPGDDFLKGNTVGLDHHSNKDVLYGGPGSDQLNDWDGGDDVFHGGDDYLVGGAGDDIIYGGDGNDFIDSSGVGQRDKLYCGEGRDGYAADKLDYVDSSCEVKQRMVGSA